MLKQNKVILVGDGAVGSSYAFSLVNRNTVRELGIIDINENKAKGDSLDLSDVLAFNSPKDIYSASYKDCKDADLVVITAGVPQKKGESRLDLVEKNLKIFKMLIKKIVENGFKGIFLVASNPVDILTYATWKFSGFDSHRVIGSGTLLDSSRFRKEISDLLNVDTRNVHAYIFGEHGDSEFPVWSNLTVGGLKIYEWIKQSKNKTDELKLLDTFTTVKNKAYEIIDLKNATFYGIAAALTKITEAILNDENAILPVSCYLNGEYGLKDIYISTSAIVSKDGIRDVIEVELNELEKDNMQKSARLLKETLNKFF